MTKAELEKEAEKKYCNGCKWRIEQCLWAWRNTNGLNEPNEKNCSCKEVPAYLAGVEPREKRIAELEAQLAISEHDREHNDYELTEVYKKIEVLEKENAKLKEFVNAPHTKGRKTTRGDYIKTVWDLSKQLTKAKEIIKDFLLIAKVEHLKDRYETVDEAEQFLNSEV